MGEWSGRREAAHAVISLQLNEEIVSVSAYYNTQEDKQHAIVALGIGEVVELWCHDPSHVGHGTIGNF